MVYNFIKGTIYNLQFNLNILATVDLLDFIFSLTMVKQVQEVYSGQHQQRVSDEDPVIKIQVFELSFFLKKNQSIDYLHANVKKTASPALYLSFLSFLTCLFLYISFLKARPEGYCNAFGSWGVAKGILRIKPTIFRFWM